MADYDWFPERHEAERQRAHKERINFANGFYTEYKYTSTGRSDEPAYYKCRRGCGTLVWNIQDHIKNVCPTFSPVEVSDA